jgi:pyruvate,water dikinase
MSLSDTYVIPLEEANHKNLHLVGGKAAALGQMLNAKIPVPSGIVVTTAAFLKGMTSDIKEQIFTAFDVLDYDRVAVRSSAIFEDSDTASWAGQLESYMNVHREELIDAVEKCWRSVISDRVKLYASAHNNSVDKHEVAVIIQAMVDSDISGVLFTANPISKLKNEVVIEAIFGLGELIVQGVVTPESIIVKTPNVEIVHRKAHKQSKFLTYKNGKSCLLPLPENLSEEQVLDNEKLEELLKIATRIQAYFGKPQDIEWAYSQGRLSVLQSRPITTL